MREFKNKLSVALVVLTSVMLFFGFVFSSLPLWPKAGLALLTLVLTGFALHKLTGVDSFYGFLIVRSFAGFNFMQSFAQHHPRFSREVTDFGATLAFGLPFGWKVFGAQKAALHLVLVLLFLAITWASRFLAALSVLWPGGEIYFFAVGLLGGLAGMGFLGITLHAYNVFTVPNTPPGVQLLIPGVTVPWEAIFAIAIIAIVHELAHGVLCYVEKLKLKSSGVLLLGFLPVGAFVEPDEEKLDKLSLAKKRRILVAGSTSNALFFLVFFVLTLTVAALLPYFVEGVVVSSIPQNSSVLSVVPVGAKLIELDGKAVKDISSLYSNVNASHNPTAHFEFEGKLVETHLMEVVISKVDGGYPASALLGEGERFRSVEGKPIVLPSDIASVLSGKKAGDTIRIETNAGAKTITLGKDARIGIQASLAPVALMENQPKTGWNTVYSILAFVLLVFSLTFLLNILIAVINLLPLFITDGHKLLFYELEPWLGKAWALKASTAAGFLVLAVIVVNTLPWFWS